MPSSIGFLSTYPPTPCGLANFTAALVRNLSGPGSDLHTGVVMVVDAPVTTRPPGVVGLLQSRARSSYHAASGLLNTFDLAVVQHDYDIYGGPDGDWLLTILDELRVPVILVVHTVLSAPSPHQRQTLRAATLASTAVVAMTTVARDRLVADYGVDAGKVTVIPYGAHDRGPHLAALPGRRPLIVTWGLLGPGKGIEWAIDGLHKLRLLTPQPAYLVAGPTHPRVRQRQGEIYRLQLTRRARAVGVATSVRFERAYLDERSLTRLVQRADVILLPYDSRDQATSGVLVEAVVAGKPIVATGFPHAVELLGDGAGLVVPHGDAVAIGAAVRRIITEPGLADALSTEATRLAPTLLWPAVAKRYRALAASLSASRKAIP